MAELIQLPSGKWQVQTSEGRVYARGTRPEMELVLKDLNAAREKPTEANTPSPTSSAASPKP